MSKTYRVNPETHAEEQERNYLKRKKKEDYERRRTEGSVPDYCETDEKENEQDD